VIKGDGVNALGHAVRSVGLRLLLKSPQFFVGSKMQMQ
jgi:hypothetical protein